MEQDFVALPLAPTSLPSPLRPLCLVTSPSAAACPLHTQDRTPFTGLVAAVADHLRAEVPACSPTRPVYLLGESFGGLLALAVAAGEWHGAARGRQTVRGWSCLVGLACHRPHTPATKA